MRPQAVAVAAVEMPSLPSLMSAAMEETAAMAAVLREVASTPIRTSPQTATPSLAIKPWEGPAALEAMAAVPHSLIRVRPVTVATRARPARGKAPAFTPPETYCLPAITSEITVLEGAKER